MTVRKNSMFATLALFMVGTATPAAAVKYMSLGNAVKRFIPTQAKIVKVVKKLNPDDREALARDYGWQATESSYTFYVGRDGGKDVAYVFVVPEIFNTCFHKYAVGMDGNGKILDTVIVELSCPRSFRVNSRGFLSQFRDKSHTDPLTTRVDIDGVTGATLSSEATSTAARKAVSLHNLFFMGAKPVNVTARVREARAAAQRDIKRAIETGKTLAREGKSGAAQLSKEP